MDWAAAMLSPVQRAALTVALAVQATVGYIVQYFIFLLKTPVFFRISCTIFAPAASDNTAEL